MAMAVPVLLLHGAGFVLIDIPVLIGIHLFKHHIGVACMLVPANLAIIIGVRHGHSATPLAILLVAPLVAIPILAGLVSSLIVMVAMRISHHVAFFERLRRKRVLGGRSDRSCPERCSESGP